MGVINNIGQINILSGCEYVLSPRLDFQVFKLFYLDGWHDLDKVYYLLRGTNPMKTRMLLPFSVTIEQTPSTKEDRKMHLKTSEKASKWILSKVNFSSFCQIAYFSFQAMLKFINTKFLTALPITLIMSHQTTVYMRISTGTCSVGFKYMLSLHLEV